MTEIGGRIIAGIVELSCDTICFTVKIMCLHFKVSRDLRKSTQVYRNYASSARLHIVAGVS